ncbi:bifunctional adenosylcobinamide kinase/adenosylcobinamide-phosphate guanylyltransferase [Aminiphilus sp.]|uniref:bifunctional adenosylcobinamide kinase/adenosylcobinamide-phosphate guanylyltransferase n=1 Tax=Aminiphilus sp. TaxID=1872488 RepID=UPI0026340642|nr:bifunctional adenosylcobinamide kinase/adenosylcobinamide-phosphate guanylyltransferase [Aminiphilus sp.]
MSSLTLFLGGMRSGKSRLAQTTAERLGGGTVTYVATADVKDAEMAARIALHRAARPETWHTLEGTPEKIPEKIRGIRGILLLDCLTLWLSRLLLAEPSADGEDLVAWNAAEKRILDLLEHLLDAPARSAHFLVVSNEVGHAPIPPYRLGRRFVDLQGRANQVAAARADAVAFVVAGIPQWLKGTPPDMPDL